MWPRLHRSRRRGCDRSDYATRLPLGYARAHRLLVLKEDENSVLVVCGDPLNTAALDDVRATFGKRLVVTVAPPAVVNEVHRVYERQDTTSDLEGSAEVVDADTIDILESDDDAPIIRWVNSLFAQAAKERASDIHIEPEEKEVLVRYRVDGELYVARRAPRQFMSSVIARVKIMAGRQHRGEAPAAGRAYLAAHRRPLRRRACLDYPDESRS